MRYDDGFVAYLNGTEIARRNAPVTPGWDSTATTDRNFASASTQETIDVSLKMGELSLLPAVRKAPADALIVADGTSCRHQIHDGTDRDALHVARVLAMSVAAGGA